MSNWINYLLQMYDFGKGQQPEVIDDKTVFLPNWSYEPIPELVGSFQDFHAIAVEENGVLKIYNLDELDNLNYIETINQGNMFANVKWVLDLD